MLKKIVIIIIISVSLCVLSIVIESNFLETYLKQNLVLILITLLAINITTLSVILTRLKDIVDKYGGDFALTISEMYYSLKEQLILISIAILILLFSESKMITSLSPCYDLIFNILLTAIFIYAIDILRDTGNAIFSILKFDQKDKDSKSDVN